MLFRARSAGCLVVLTLAFVLATTSVWGFKEFVAPRPESADTYPSKDGHPNEKVTAAIDLYNSAPKDDIFGTDYAQEGILPVLLVITNGGGQPISTKDMHAELVTGSRSKLEALSVDDVFRRVAHIKASSTSPARVGPIPLPNGSKNKKAREQYDELTKAAWVAEAVEPHATKSGFLFFDVQGIKNPVAGSHLYLTGMRDASGNELMYFEISVGASNP